MFLESVVDKLFINWHELYTELKPMPVLPDNSDKRQQLRNEMNELVEAVVIIRTHKDNK